MVRYAITSEEITAAELARVAEKADFVQLRTPGWDAGRMLAMARSLPPEVIATKLLIHGRVDVAMACGAAGVHLSSRHGELTPQQVRVLMPQAVVTISCHTLRMAMRARGANFVLFAPVFEKLVNGEVVVVGVGLEALREVCVAAAPVRVLALGGVTKDNAASCVEAGAAGVAGIRLFR